MIQTNGKTITKIMSGSREIVEIKDTLTGKIIYQNSSDPNNYKLLIKQYIEGTLEVIQ